MKNAGLLDPEFLDRAECAWEPAGENALTTSAENDDDVYADEEFPPLGAAPGKAAAKKAEEKVEVKKESKPQVMIPSSVKVKASK